MNLTVNGESRDLPEGTTVLALLERLGLAGSLVAVERNQSIVPRAEHATTVLSAGDEVEVVHFVGGG